MIWFALWREYKLSTAEILAVFSNGKTIYFNKDVLILEWIDRNEVLEKADFLWWTIKIFEISENEIIDDTLEVEWKFKYWIMKKSKTNNR